VLLGPGLELADALGRLVELAGDFSHRQLIPIEQRKDQPLLRGERFDSPREGLPVGLVGFPPRLARQDGLDGVDRNVTEEIFPVPITQDVPDVVKEPPAKLFFQVGPERDPTAAIVLPQNFEEDEPSLLQEVLVIGESTVAEDLLADEGKIPGEEAFRCLEVSGLGCLHKGIHVPPLL
jgi:hypothetical protein